MRLRSSVAAAGAGVALLMLQACGGSDEDSSSQEPGSAEISVADTSLGDVLVDSEGRTLYMFEPDSPTKSTCMGSCEANWPVVAASKAPSHTADVSAKLAVIDRSDGKKQVVAGDWPLYTFVGDEGPGDVTGQGLNTFGGLWYVVSPAGEPIESAPSGGNDGGGYDGY